MLSAIIIGLAVIYVIHLIRGEEFTLSYAVVWVIGFLMVDMLLRMIEKIF